MHFIPALFLIVAEGLSRMIATTKRRGEFQGIQVVHNFSISHLLFVNDILIFCNGDLRDL